MQSTCSAHLILRTRHTAPVTVCRSLATRRCPLVRRTLIALVITGQSTATRLTLKFGSDIVVFQLTKSSSISRCLLRWCSRAFSEGFFKSFALLNKVGQSCAFNNAFRRRVLVFDVFPRSSLVFSKACIQLACFSIRCDQGKKSSECLCCTMRR